MPNNCKDNTFSFWTQSSGSNLRMYKASNTARCNKDLPRDKTENTSSEYHSRQLALPDRWHLIAEVPFPWPDDLAVVTSDPAACESLPLRPASLQFRLPRSRSDSQAANSQDSLFCPVVGLCYILPCWKLCTYVSLTLSFVFRRRMCCLCSCLALFVVKVRNRSLDLLILIGLESDDVKTARE